MQGFVHKSETQFAELHRGEARLSRLWTVDGLLCQGIYAVSLAVSICIWFLAIRAPLWEDETGSFWVISKGFSEILGRQGSLSFPPYSYMLWFLARIVGTSEIALRIPSVLVMLGAAYLLYLAAREIFDKDISIIASVIFCINPIVIFASIDIRPYAFALLATNAAILVVLRFRCDNSNRLAVLFGLLAAFVVYFHYLFAVILPAFIVCFVAVRRRSRVSLWRPLGVALAVFAFACLPVIPGLLQMVGTRGTHVYEGAPAPWDLFWTLAPGWALPVVGGVGLVVLIVTARTLPQRGSMNDLERWQALICASLALIPALFLYGVSAATSIHVFAERHRLVAVPGIALCWAFGVARFPGRARRLLVCVALVTTTAFSYFSSPTSNYHKPSWKYAIEFIEEHASVDNAPVMMCSGFVESNYAAMPVDSAKDSRLFSWLSYYKLTVPIVPMPTLLNDEAVRVGSQFLQAAAKKHQRFLAAAHSPSLGTLEWLEHSASGAYTVKKLGDFDGVEVLEFSPRTTASDALPRF